ncbi:MAG TPA: (d)CMP kinase [Steroidobacteraceae bacterium]|nr:(d)CMP kinase [Steroidobacteraceae bacterium]HQW09733.1 (d)CMP kinase [Steroidobacteraceae bacterium]HQX47460.1 (d)CMP kinase [Steroidobacteraceae bacterium]HQX77354.1 (d)CMP kinase [Steroidobacteraceae bacterium]HQZ79781.1 (d)CMP kinase [Steroidobacteraceae bacterium]
MDAARPVPVVTIDGPSGSGKGTISREVARHLGWHLLDSGALYRLVALSGSLKGLTSDDVTGHAALARAMSVEFSGDERGGERIRLDRVDVTREVRSEETGQGASRVAAWSGVREALLERQRAFALPPGLVADGRDMGTVIFPAADLKIYLTASASERALRRYKQLKEKGSDANLAALSREIAERDQRDSTRVVAPLRPAPDARVIDSTGMSIAQVVESVLSAGRARGLWS